jgi:hypothetical protein
MSTTAKILSLSYDSAVATKTVALKTYWRSVRLIKNSGAITSPQPSYVTNILLCGNCIDPETRNLYVFYIDTKYNAAWIIEINIDTRVQTVVYYDKYNVIGFDPLFKIYNAKVVHGRLIWTNNKNPIYQMDIARAKKSFYYKIGYGQFPITENWSAMVNYSIDQIVSNGNNFYKSIIHDNLTHEPKTDSFVNNIGTYWEKLCLIEDAYYSMNVQNFYFEPMPPKHPPVVMYESDDTRKINNLRQTLFQVAYRYIYMDWRKSTFSPASIVPVPQAEEETATGLVNEQISLNNKLKITINTGGEEVRAIDIIGRSSQDTSKWFLIETIEKFSSQERAFELSLTANLESGSLGLSVKDPVAINESIVNVSDKTTMSISVLWHRVILSYVSLTVETMTWAATLYGSNEGISTTITISPGMATVIVMPDWVTVILVSRGHYLMVGSEINSGEELLIYPTALNEGNAKTGYVIFMSDGYMDAARIAITHEASITPPVGIPVSCVVLADPDDTSGLVILSQSTNATSGNKIITINVTVHVPGYGIHTRYDIHWWVTINGTIQGGGLFTGSEAFLNDINIERQVVVDTNPLVGDVIIVYLSRNLLI